MLKLINISKRYKNSDRYSVKGLSLDIKQGEIFGFLGKNGAGKSTSIKCITGILPYESGKITVCGYDMEKDPINCKMNIGYVPDNHAVYENLTGTEYVNYIANLYRVPKKTTEERLKKFVALFNMSHAVDNQIRSYSHGMKQKICIIAALIHNPRLWVLDEPLMGLDPQSAFEIKSYMKEHKEQGNTVFFSSHNIDMVEKLCDRVAIINKGELLEIVNIPEFLATSKVSLEEYFLDLTRNETETNMKIAEENLSKRERRKILKRLNKEEKLAKRQSKSALSEKIKSILESK